MPFDIEYFLICVFGKIINQIKTSENPVKSILLSNFPFHQKECFWEEKSPEMRFWEISSVFGNIFGKAYPILGKQNPFLGKEIAQYQEVLLCVRKVTKEDVKRRI